MKPYSEKFNNKGHKAIFIQLFTITRQFGVRDQNRFFCSRNLRNWKTKWKNKIPFTTTLHNADNSFCEAPKLYQSSNLNAKFDFEFSWLVYLILLGNTSLIAKFFQIIKIFRSKLTQKKNADNSKEMRYQRSYKIN